MAKQRSRKQSSGVIKNRRASFDYSLGDDFLAGLVLNGREVKSLRLGHGNLSGAYVTLKDGELWLINATIHGTNGIPLTETEQTQARKLLLKQREIDAITSAKQQGRQIIPTAFLVKGRFIKLRLSIGTSKKHYDKRQAIKKREDTRQTLRALKNQ